jgi:hypothetical protein
VVTEEKLNETGTRLEHTPLKSLRHLAHETSISKSSEAKGMKLLELWPCKVMQLAGLISATDFCIQFMTVKLALI